MGTVSLLLVVLTWKQYRDHTQEVAFPVWHASAIGTVPVYSLFRIRAHMRVFRELMLQAGQATTISTGRAVGLMIAFTVLNGAPFVFSELSTTYKAALGMLVTEIGSVAVVISIL
ncbi:MAG: hypothetical protein QGG34_14250 [SAR202 cluster bacterium]|nr:hypothetical protein [SAR202 cluster bacterium]MDP7226555.1 hypothetical protein [SAR202 cluster bacterium]MDP7532562.1 hypothetical protein [SAR202 cluster bacterium]